MTDVTNAAEPVLTPKSERRFRRFLRLHELPLLIGLTVTWMMLWREVSLLSFTSGVIVSIFATRIFYLPPMTLVRRFNVWYVLRYLYFFFTQLVLASIQVSWLAVRPGAPPPTAIIATPLHTKSDFILTMTALTNSLIPGSLVAEVDRFTSTLYVHVIDTASQVEIENARSSVLHIEWLLIHAIGSREELEELK